MKTLSQLGMMLLAVGLMSPVFAQEGQHIKKRARRNVEQRVVNQERRIDHKVAKGKMTAEEAKVEREKVGEIAEKRAEMVKENGNKPLTKEQRKELNKELNQTSKEIKNSGAVAPSPTQPSAH